MNYEGIGAKKQNMIIETFADYVEHYYDEDNNPEDIPTIVKTHFDEFVDWAYDDFLLDEADVEFLKDLNSQPIRSQIKVEVIRYFQEMLKTD